MAVMQAARFILEKNDGRDCIETNYRIVNRSLEYPINIKIYDAQSELRLDWEEITGIKNHGITIEIAREIMMQAQDIRTKLDQDRSKETHLTEQVIDDSQSSPIAVAEA